jgi:hypothetical protein
MKEKKFRIVTRVTEKEFEIIKQKAKKAGLSVSEFIRQAAIKAPNRSPIGADYGQCREHMDKLLDYLESSENSDEARAVLEQFALHKGR